MEISAPESLDELSGLRCHVDPLVVEFGQRPSEGADAAQEWGALVNQHELLAPDDTEASAHGCGRLEGLDPNFDPEPFGGLEQFVKEIPVVHPGGLWPTGRTHRPASQALATQRVRRNIGDRARIFLD